MIAPKLCKMRFFITIGELAKRRGMPDFLAFLITKLI